MNQFNCFPFHGPRHLSPGRPYYRDPLQVTCPMSVATQGDNPSAVEDDDFRAPSSLDSRLSVP